MMQGAIGWPEGGFPKVLQKIILDSAGEKPIKGRPGAKLPKVDFAATRKELAAKIRPRAAATRMCCRTCSIRRFSAIIEKHVQKYDNTSVLPTPAFFYGLQSGEEISVEIEPGKTLIIKYLTTGDAARGWHAHGLLRAERPAARGGGGRSIAGREPAQASQGRPG